MADWRRWRKIEENPYGPERGRFNIRLRYAERWPKQDSPPKDLEEWLAYFVGVLDAFSADLDNGITLTREIPE